MKVAIITGNQPRHAEFIRTIEKNFDDTFVIIERKRNQGLLFQKENQYFDPLLKTNGESILCEKGEPNSDHFRKKLKTYAPDIMFVFGCSLLKEEIFSIPKRGCVNIHTGLVQLYRGVDSAFWAIHDAQPHGIGATVHYVDNSIDGGDVIVQARAGISRGDTFSDLFLKSCKCGFGELGYYAEDIAWGHVDRKKLDRKGKLYNSRDLTDKAIHRAEILLPEVLEWYVSAKPELDRQFFLENRVLTHKLPYKIRGY